MSAERWEDEETGRRHCEHLALMKMSDAAEERGLGRMPAFVQRAWCRQRQEESLRELRRYTEIVCEEYGE